MVATICWSHIDDTVPPDPNSCDRMAADAPTPSAVCNRILTFQHTHPNWLLPACTFFRYITALRACASASSPTTCHMQHTFVGMLASFLHLIKLWFFLTLRYPVLKKST